MSTGRSDGSKPAAAPPAAHRARRRGHALLALAVVGLVAWGYLGSVRGVWAVHSDSACYLGLARSLAHGEGYRFNHALFGKYPPVFPLLLSAVYGTVGEHWGWLQAVVALSGAAAVAAAYVLVRAREGHWPALAVAALTGTCTWFWTYAAICILPQMTYAFFSLVALWWAERAVGRDRFVPWRWVLATGLVLVAIFTHLSGAALVPAVCAAVLFARGMKWPLRQRLAAAAMVGLVCTGATLCWVKRGWRAGIGSGYTNLMTHEPMDMLQNPFPKLKLRASEWAATPLGLRSETFPWPVGAALLATLLLPGLVRGFRRRRSCAEWYVCSYFAVMFIHGGMGGKERYVVPIVPVLFYYGYLSLEALGAWAGARLSRPPGARAAGRRLPRLALAAVALALAGRGLYERHRERGGARAFSRGWQQANARAIRDWTEAAGWVEQYGPPGGTIYPGPGGVWATIHFFTGQRVGKLHYRWRGMRILRSMVDWDAGLVLAQRHAATNEGVLAAMKAHPDCFTHLHDNSTLMLYRIDKKRLRAIVAAADSPQTGTPP